ncbi:hypothetical protein [uncultured Roseobacter sp.]|uniref:hypothetical protein n=1 Tax=uncultured Roseobacter sp. TaxID=114847 RepID=UPI0026208AB9|nr:hypothetical protein [uncultured Roseobacter sp.]
MVEIVDQTSARAWLETKGHQTRIRFAARCALRGLPGIGLWSETVESGFAFASFRAAFITTAVATSKDSHSLDLAEAVAATRANSNSGLGGGAPVQIATDAGDGLIFALGAAATSDNSVESAVGSLRCSSGVIRKSADGTENVSEGQAAFSAASMDANAFLDMESRALWGDEVTPEIIQSGWNALKNQLAINGQDWAFWIEWYEGILKGEPLPLDLTRRIALEVTDADWDAGPKRVSERIEEIRLKLKVKTLAEELAEAAYRAQPGTRGIGDNKGPSLEDDLLLVQPTETITWVAASELRHQAESDAPEPSRIEQAVSLLAGVLKAVGLWIAGTVATGISVASVAVIKKGADAWAIQNQDKLVELIDTTLRWLSLMN